ncbi:MAG: thioredoxin domain-containing protein [Dehalococcoidia bacterium]|nr:thioredoxin domain-containing protein [Dehalococcoidia bacterium]
MSGFRFSSKPNKANQIQWRAWDGRAFLDAKLSDKPILLSLSAAWCQWCHMMDETTYSDDEIIRQINRDFVTIRVDSDQRPDINQRYSMGGLPTTVFLTPDGDIMTGATYVDPDGMKPLLSHVAGYYSSGKLDIQLVAAQTRARQKEWAEGFVGGQKLPDVAFDDILSTAAIRFDSVYGGFGVEPKSPPWDILDLLLHGYQISGNIRYLLMVSKTLDQLMSRPIFDPVDGGFFCYSMTREWNSPNFGKTLGVNAAGLRTYSRMFQATNEQSYREAAQGVAMFLDDVLWYEPGGVFYGSRDANPEYYRLHKPERESAPKPRVDRTIYTDWNALAASVYLESSTALRQPHYKDKAIKVLRFLWDRCWDENLGMCHYFAVDGPKWHGLLSDQVYMAKALLDAYQFLGEFEYFERAKKVVDLIMRDYSAPAGGFYDICGADDAAGTLKFRDRIIGQNSLAAGILNRLYQYSLDDRYKEAAMSALQIFSGSYRSEADAAAPYALAIYQCTVEPLHIVIVGNPASADTKALLASSLELQGSNKIVQVLDPEGQADLIEDLGYAPEPAPAAYVCYNMTCSVPITDPDTIGPVVKSMTAGDVRISPAPLNTIRRVFP